MHTHLLECYYWVSTTTFSEGGLLQGAVKILTAKVPLTPVQGDDGVLSIIGAQFTFTLKIFIVVRKALLTVAVCLTI